MASIWKHARDARRGALPALLAITLVSAGCARVEYGSEFREDGSATHSVLVVLQRADLDEQDATFVADRLRTIEQQARADGLEVERIDEDRETGLRISTTTANSEDAGAALNALINSVDLGTGSGPVAPFQGTFSTGSGAVGGAAFELEMTVDTDIIMSAVAALMPPGRSLPNRDELPDALQLAYIVVMPGHITDSNGRRIRPDTVRWDLPHEGQLVIRAESKLGEEGSTAWFVVAAIGAVVGVAAISGLVGLVLVRRRRKTRTRARQSREEGAAGPDTLAEAGSTLARVVGRVVTGNEPDERRPPETPVQE